VGTKIRLHFASLLCARRLILVNAPQTKLRIITAIFHHSIISIVSALNSYINTPGLCTPINRTQGMFLVPE